VYGQREKRGRSHEAVKEEGPTGTEADASRAKRPRTLPTPAAASLEASGPLVDRLSSDRDRRRFEVSLRVPGDG
jgi:hypothetical protein